MDNNKWWNEEMQKDLKIVPMRKPKTYSESLLLYGETMAHGFHIRLVGITASEGELVYTVKARIGSMTCSGSSERLELAARGVIQLLVNRGMVCHGKEK